MATEESDEARAALETAQREARAKVEAAEAAAGDAVKTSAAGAGSALARHITDGTTAALDAIPDVNIDPSGVFKCVRCSSCCLCGGVGFGS